VDARPASLAGYGTILPASRQLQEGALQAAMLNPLPQAAGQVEVCQLLQCEPLTDSRLSALRRLGMCRLLLSERLS
jgi:hypothetical protein